MKMSQEQTVQSLDYEVLIFGRFRLDPVQHVLYERDKPLRLGSRALEILIVLTERSGEVVSKNELIARVWPKSVVQEATLRVHIAALRKALGDGEHGARYVENFSGRGYRFVAHVIHRQEHFTLDPAHEPLEPCATQDSATQRASSLPVPLTELIGRDQVVSMLASRIPRRRLVTIVGPGGIGKTVVARAVAENLSHGYEHGVYFADLSILKDPRQLAETLTDVLDLPAEPGDLLHRIVTFLRARSMLIVLDNCEHVVEAAAAIAEKVLQCAPGIHLLATSREPLRAESEYVHRLSALEAPKPSATLTRAEALGYPAVELFIERASANVDSFELHDSDIPVAVEICSRLDGNPLAIELAAARVDVFGLRGLAARLDNCLRILTIGRRTALPRHQSLRATLDWSYELLSPTEQAVLCRLAVLSSRCFDMEAATAVVEDGKIRATAVFDTVTTLVAKSLLVKEVSGDRILYRFPEATQAYALEKLQACEELARTNLPHETAWASSGAAA
jgi:predicted ATPase/DNA-binding winged helix-turn-helix (wHTH) protein